MSVHSERKTFAAEHPDTLQPFSMEYRRKNRVYAVFHIEDKVLELKTKSHDKANLASEYLSQAIFEKPQQFPRYVNFKQKRAEDNVRIKKAIFSGLSFAGADEISIKGEDVNQTIEVLKQNNVDLKKMASQISYDKREAENTFFIYQDGRVVYRAKLENPYYKFKELFTFA